MGYPDARNPREVRSLIHNVYAGYVSGQDTFPKKRMQVPTEALPRKTQPVAAVLEGAWAEIDEDRAYFQEAVLGTFDALEASDRDEEEKNGLVIVRIGRNAVNLAQIKVAPKRTVSITELTRQEFLSRFEGYELKLRQGGAVALRAGQVQGEAGGIIIRRSNTAGVFGTTPEETTALMTAVSTTPVQTVAG